MDRRPLARSIFLETLRHLDLSETFKDRVRSIGETLHIGEHAYELQHLRRILLIAIGKAAAPMHDHLRPIVDRTAIRGQAIEALVVSPTPPSGNDRRSTWLHGSHPTPTQASRDAARAILARLHTCDNSCLVLFLISGGASSMVEQALDPSLTLEDEADLHRALVHSGLPIQEMNALRKHLSTVKGGRLAVAAGDATQCTLLISDVPPNLPHTIGSGPSLPDPSTLEDCREIIAGTRHPLHLPAKILANFNNPALPETPKPGDRAFAKSAWISLLSSNDMCDHARKEAERHRFHTVIDNRCDDWDYREAAAYLIARLHDLHQQHGRVCLLSAGELSVPLPQDHGIGGRNQQFALECASLLAEQHLHATVLSAGSDGIDGNSPAAGAVVDQTTQTRATATGLDIATTLNQFDSYTLLHRLGDTIITGPTGTNVRDLRILLTNT